MNPDDYEHYQAQGALNQRQLDSQANVYAPQLQEQFQQSQAILVEQTNPSKVVQDILLRLQGLEIKPDGTKVKVAEPKVNKVGIENIWFILASHINQNVILSHLDEIEISRMMDTIGRDIVRDLSLNAKRYGIQKKTDKDIINNSILINIFLALKRAQGQNEKNWLSKISVENISSQVRLPSMKKDSFWGKFRL